MEYVTVQSVLFIKPHCVPIMAELLQKDILEDEELGMDQENRLDVEQMIELLEKHDFKKLKEELESVHPVDIVDALEELDKKQRILIFRLLAKEEAAEVFTDMNSDMREDLINALTDSELEEVMEEMYVDDTVDVLEEMPANVVDRLLMATDEETRKKINALLQYPEDSAGSIMNIEYISLRKEMTVADAILKIRQVGINKETIYTCYVTEKRRLIGMVDVKDLLTAGESRLIEEIMDENVLYARTLDDQEHVANMINKYGLVAIPVIDHEDCLVGIVTVDDAMLVLQDETTEDIIQDVFAKLWTQPEVWLENKDIGQYIYAMTKNTTFNFIKRKRLEQSYQEQLSQKYLIEDLLKSEDTLDPIYYKEALLIIRLILDRLPERRRKVFEMSRINNMSNMEIAQALNISVRTVEHQIYLTLLEIKKTIFIAFFLCFF